MSNQEMSKTSLFDKEQTQELTLREPQPENIAHIRKLMAEKHRMLIFYASTGFGKTECAIYMMMLSAKKGKKSVMILDRRVLVNQTSERLDRYGISHGVIMAKHWRRDESQLIQICSAQTIEAMGTIPQADVYYVDEAHCSRKKIIEFMKHTKAYVLGLTASPFTKGLSSIYTAVAGCTTTKQLVDIGRLAPLRVFIAKAEIDMAGAKKVCGEWSDKDATEKGIKITGDVVATWVEKTHEIFHKPVKTIVFCAGVAHGIDLAKKFQAAGYNFVSISYKDDDNEETIKQFVRHDSDIMGIIACEILCKGFDCILEGSQVLTNNGLVAIEKLSIYDKVWDGHDYVSHGGAIYKGEKDVITYCGLTATPDHKVKTKNGWISFGEAARKQIAIITTGNGGKRVWENEGCFTRDDSRSREGKVVIESLLSMRMYRLRRKSKYSQKFIAKWEGSILQKLREYLKSSNVDCIKVQAHAETMQQQKTQGLSKLWWARNRVQVLICSAMCRMDSSKYWDSETRQEYAVRQNRQQWALRSWEFTLGKQRIKQLQFSARRLGGYVTQIQDFISRNTLLRQNAKKFIYNGINSRNDSREVSQEIIKTKGRVWDILNCGQRNSFTCNNLLVHNCPDVLIGVDARPLSKSFSSHVQKLGRVMRTHHSKTDAIWIDHAGNYLRFQEKWDDLYENGVQSLDDEAEKPMKEPTKKEKEAAKCPKCGQLWQTKGDTCTHCGFTRVRRNEVTELDGTVEELKCKKEKHDIPKADFYAQVLGYSRSKGWKDGYAYKLTIEKYGTGLRENKHIKPVSPTAEVLSWIRHSQIKSRKSRGL
jgi:superfamily II DNA or RNA helicase